MAKIREADVDALRERADIVEIVSGYSRLKRSGGRTFKGLCPFHSEKTPSFTVDAAKGLYHCFGCGEGGNVYHFVQKVENLPFPEAVEWLARKVGMELTYEESRPGERRAHGVKLRLLQANEAAAAFFHQALLRAPEAKAALDYLSGRGFGRDVAERWVLGYAPGRDALCRHLLDRRSPSTRSSRPTSAGAASATDVSTTRSATASCSRRGTSRATSSGSALARSATSSRNT